MAQSNKRYFNTFFFEDPYIEDLDSETKFLYLTMILNPHNNFAGCYEISIKKLMAYTGLPEDKIRLGIQRLQQDRKILFTGTWLSLKNFIKNNELNPNMCKKSYENMKLAPKENILFIIADPEGNAEPWVTEFVEKVEKGINAAIDSKNRNALAHAKKHGLPEPLPLHHERFCINTFSETILKPTQTQIRGKGSPHASPNPSFSLPEPSGEYEREYEYEVEREKEKEKEIGNHGQSFEPYIPPTNLTQSKNLYDSMVNHWNSKGNLVKALSSLNNPEALSLCNIISEYGEDYVKQAIDNLSENIMGIESKYRPGSLTKFLKNSVGYWAEYKGEKVKSQEELEEFNRMLGEIYK